MSSQEGCKLENTPETITNFKITKVRRDRHQRRQDSHVHSYYEILYVINGYCTFFSGHNIYQLNQGDLIIVPQGTLHKSTYPETGYSERYVINFPEKGLEWLRQLVDKEIIQEMLQAGAISIPDKRREYLESLMSQMLTEFEGQDMLSPAFIQAELLEILLFIIRCQRFSQNVVKEFDETNQLIQDVATYVYENFHRHITLSDTALKFHISRSYLSKKFKAVTGFGFKEYLINIRIQNACRMLLETNRSITDISLSCGFNDSNYFGDAFRHVKGVSPNHYRKNREMI